MRKRGIFIIILLILIIASILYFTLRTEQCDTSGCFEASAIKCEKKKITLEESNGSISEYTIKGKNSDNCILHVKLKKAPGFSQELKNKFENKDMTCFIPHNEFSRMKVEDMGNNLDYCHGPLKEEIYDVVIKRLYKLVVRDMTTILEEVERTI